jgi:predicted nucleic acid-binding protein
MLGCKERNPTYALAAFMLAQELSANFVVLDDLLARRKAQHLTIEVI